MRSWLRVRSGVASGRYEHDGRIERLKYVRSDERRDEPVSDGPETDG